MLGLERLCMDGFVAILGITVGACDGFWCCEVTW
jgi:hypothetical protein